MTDEAERTGADDAHADGDERRARLHARLTVDVPKDVSQYRRRRSADGVPAEPVRLRSKRAEPEPDDAAPSSEAAAGSVVHARAVVADTVEPTDDASTGGGPPVDGVSTILVGPAGDAAPGAGSTDDATPGDSAAAEVAPDDDAPAARDGDAQGDDVAGEHAPPGVDDPRRNAPEDDGGEDDAPAGETAVGVAEIVDRSDEERSGPEDDGGEDDAPEKEFGLSPIADGGDRAAVTVDPDPSDLGGETDDEPSPEGPPTEAVAPVPTPTDREQSRPTSSVFDDQADDLSDDDDDGDEPDPDLDHEDWAWEGGPAVVLAPATTTHAQRPWWRKLIAACLLLSFVVAGIGLAVKGARIVRDSTEGKVLSPVDDPTEPGFVAFVAPTPTLVFVHHEGDRLLGVAVLTLPDNDTGGGGVVLLSPRTIADLGVLGSGVLADGYFFSGGDFVRSRVSNVVGTGILELAEADEERIAALVEPVAPLRIDNPDRLVTDGPDGEPVVRFESGSIDLAADDVHDFLRFRLDDESELAHLVRVELFWNAWIDAIASSSRADAVPGETGSGLGRFLRVIAGGTAVIETLPVTVTRTDFDDLGPALRPVPVEVDALMAPLVPLPVSSEPGARVRVRVLNGTSDTINATVAALSLTPAGAEIAVVGNASEFGLQTTTIEYVSPDLVDEAEALREVLGVGLLSLTERPSEVAEITVTLGADYGTAS